LLGDRLTRQLQSAVRLLSDTGAVKKLLATVLDEIGFNELPVDSALLSGTIRPEDATEQAPCRLFITYLLLAYDALIDPTKYDRSRAACYLQSALDILNTQEKD
jgi:hypothetical protein